MFRMLTYLFSFVLAASLLLTSAVGAAEPGLVGWWKLDDGVGTTATDSSGRGHNGIFAEGTPTWVEGKYGKALQFNGANKVEVPDHPDFHMQDAITIALWIKPEAAEPEYAKLFIKQRSDEYPYGIQYTGNAQSIRATVYASARFDSSNTPNFPGEWGHLCMTYDGSALLLYRDGKEVARLAASGKIQQNNLSLSIGGRLESTQNFIGIIDDARLYNKALTPVEIKKVMERPPVGTASKPSPNAGAEDVPRDVVLSWMPGEVAAPTDGHTVYFSERFEDVVAGIGGVTQSAAIYDPGRLEFSTTYYWRVDESSAPPDSTVFRGDIWSFTTEPVGYPIDGVNIIATASSMGNATFGPENTIDGSGLDANDLHSTQPEDMWLSSNEPLGAWIQYEFDKAYKLHEMWVWNSNQVFEGLFGFGLKDVTIEYSTDVARGAALAGVPQFAKAPGTPGYAHNTTVNFNNMVAKYVKLTATSNWGGVLPQYGLSEVRFYYIPVYPTTPSPVAGAAGVEVVDATLRWRAGREAATHNVYLSTDEQAVRDGTAPVASAATASYSPPALDLNTTYYWKIAEVNEAETPTTWEGSVWSFTTSDVIVIDDFESYNDLNPDQAGSNRIFEAWKDGFGTTTNGALVGKDMPPYAEQTIVHGGKQSMPFFYSNTSGKTFSEAKRTFAAPQNWTQHGVKTLTLWFQGTAGNTGQLYVKINNSKIPYGREAGNIARTGWQPWNINLAASGLNLQAVSSLAIGIDGNGAAGTLYFDDIRLYPYEPQLITPVAPNTAGLIGLWTFDGNTQDSSGKGNHGTSGVTPPAFVPGKVGSNAMNFRGADYVSIDGVVNDITSTNITLSAWIKTTQIGEGEIFAANDAAGDHPVMFAISGGSPSVNDGRDHVFPPAVNDDQWHLLTYVRSGAGGYVYVDGILRGTYESGFSLKTVTRWSIGQEWDPAGPSNFYIGAVDDARFYNYALSDAEVASLSGRTQPFDKPF